MRLLLDTPVFLWWFLTPERLSDRAKLLLEDPDNELLLSAASSLEIAIKSALKKLELPEPPVRYVTSRLETNGLVPLPVEHVHALRVSELPLHHRDPFDRLLIAQAQLENATLATGDPAFLLYDVDLLWAASGELPGAVHDQPLERRRKKRAPSRSGTRAKKSK
jgi:PIN domain nuclease of toxin-antitoxin system